MDTSQQNGRSERKHRHVLNVDRALLFQANLSTKFWGECVLAVIYLTNRTPSTLLSRKTPYEILYHKTSSYGHIKVFGTLCFAHSKKSKDKFAPRGRRCLFVGYPFGQKGWKVFDLETYEYFVSRDAIFHRNIFLFAAMTQHSDPQKSCQFFDHIPTSFDEDFSPP